MNHRLVRIVLSLIAGSICVAIGLYFGRFIAGGVGFLVASSRQAIPFATGITWWAFTGLIAGVGLTFTAVRKRRFRVFVASFVGFALGGALAVVLATAAGGDRNSVVIVLAVPLGGALAGLLMGVSAELGARVVVMMLAGAAALWIAAPQIGSVIPPSDWISLLAPGAIIGAVLAALAKDAPSVQPSP